MSISTRHATDADRAFVLDSWLRSYRMSKHAGLIAMTDWPSVMGPQLRRILERSGCSTTVAFFDDATPGVADLAGWIAVERGFEVQVRKKVRGRTVKGFAPSASPLIHYCYIKSHYRARFGIEHRLIAAADIDPTQLVYMSCMTSTLRDLPLTRVQFEPLIARFPRRNNVD